MSPDPINLEAPFRKVSRKYDGLASPRGYLDYATAD